MVSAILNLKMKGMDMIMEKRFLECGKIVGEHGLRGEVKLLPWSSDIGELCEFETLFMDNGEKELLIDRARIQKNVILLKIAGIDTIEQAQAMRGKLIYIDRDQDSLEDGQFYIQDILGISVVDVDTEEVYGILDDVTETGANDVYYIKCPDGSTKLIPAIPDVVIEINLEDNKMSIRPLKGLFDDAEEV